MFWGGKNKITEPPSAWDPEWVHGAEFPPIYDTVRFPLF